jgi:hypothetical protein
MSVAFVELGGLFGLALLDLADGSLEDLAEVGELDAVLPRDQAVGLQEDVYVLLPQVVSYL